MRTIVPIFWGIAFILISGTGEAASFDCRNAKTNVEKLICSDPNLSKLDEEMSASYRDAFNSSKKSVAIKNGQRRWLKNFRNQCNEIDCLAREYKIRIAELTLLGKLNHRTGSNSQLSLPENNQLIAEYANRKILRELEAPSMIYALPEKVKKIFTDAKTNTKDTTLSTYLGENRYWSADFNQDGFRDHLLIQAYGSAHAQHAFVISGKDTSKLTVLHHNEKERTTADISFLKIGHQYYIISYEDYRCPKYKLRRLWKIDKSCNFSYVCSYSQLENPIIELVSGKYNPMCLNADSDKIEHANYTLKHSITKLPREERFGFKYIGKGMAKIDIDNDGIVENVVPIIYSSSAGRGWDAEYIATTDETFTTVPDTPLNHLLLEELGGRGGPYMNAFIYDGVSYIDAKSKRGHRKIYKVGCDTTPPSSDRIIAKSDSNCYAKTICEFQDRIINYVLTTK